LVSHIKIFALFKAVPILRQLREFEIQFSKEIRSSCLEKEDLVIMVLVVRQVAAFFTD